MNIKEMERKELKAMAYDIIISIQEMRNNLVLLNNEIRSRKQIIPVETPKKEEKQD